MQTRDSRRGVVTLAAALLLAGCSAGAGPDGSDSSGTASETSPPGITPTEPVPTDRPEPPLVPTDLPPDVLLTTSSLGPPEEPREETEGVTSWRLPEACDAGEPQAATAMRTVSQGDGTFEQPIMVQQVTVFADATSAATEAGHVADQMASCAAASPDTGTRYVTEDVAVGAQGRGLVTDYYGVTADDPAADGLGVYLMTTRRGSAVTLVSVESGEPSISTARQQVQGRAQAAWELLCRYDTAGCEG